MVLTTVAFGAAQAQDVVIDPSVRHQTWQGMRVTVEHFHITDRTLGDEHPIPQPILDGLLDDAVFDLGITGLRIDLPVMLSRYRPGLEPENDNADPHVLDAARIEWKQVDPYIRAIVLPMKERVERRGDRFSLNIQVIAYDTWHWDLPSDDAGAEYAEIVVASLVRLRDVFGIEPDFVTPYNEMDLHRGQDSPTVILRGIRKLVDRMRGAGFETPLVFPEVSMPERTLQYLDELERFDASLLGELGAISFHGYGSLAPETLIPIRDRARLLGIPTGQGEWWFPTEFTEDIFRTLTNADAVFYEPGVLGAHPALSATTGLYFVSHAGGTFPRFAYTTHERAPDWPKLFHFSAFFRPGDVRIESTSSDPEILSVAMESPTGAHAIVVQNAGDIPRRVTIRGTRADDYRVYVTDGARTAELVEVQTISDGEALAMDLSPGGLATFVGERDRTPVSPDAGSSEADAGSDAGWPGNDAAVDGEPAESDGGVSDPGLPGPMRADVPSAGGCNAAASHSSSMSQWVVLMAVALLVGFALRRGRYVA